MSSLHKVSSKKILQTIENTISGNKMFHPGDRVLVAVSGGQDSVALLHVLFCLVSKLDISLGIAHLNHDLRGNDAEKDAAFVEQLAREVGVPFFYKKEKVKDFSVKYKLSLEEAGRVVRYKFFRHIMAEHGYSRVALGHHADDNTEQILMYLIRGSGPLGASGIQPVRDDGAVRPLIDLYRSDIEAYIKENRLKYVEDASNQDTRFVRNRVRYKLLPFIISDFNENIGKSLNRFASILRCEDEWIEKTVQPEFDRIVKSKEADKILFSKDVFNTLHLALKRRMLRKAIESVKGNLRRINFDHIDTIIIQAEKKGFAEQHLPGRIRIIFDDRHIIFQKEKKALRSIDPVYKERSSFNYCIKGPGSIRIKEIEALLTFSVLERDEGPDLGNCEKDTAFFDMDAIAFPMMIRSFAPGDRFTPLGMNGSQKVKKYFIDHKIGRMKRAVTPMLLSAGRIIWVVGHKIDNSVKVNPDTKRILKAEFFLPNTSK